MSKALILDYSSAVHTESTAKAVTEGVRCIGASVDLERVAEAAPSEISESADVKLDQLARVVSAADLGLCDSTTFSAPPHFRRMPWQLAAILKLAGRQCQRTGVGLAGSHFRCRLIAETANKQFDN
ncbi:hypothetical protein [Thiomonas sp. FB-Cd]|uniref:hypothetical protein n=1 Tax=Thiomonas sp. FB-Cd TaxID=1158292 RepID=UPI000690AB2A|nr:hypothetical protein [Thiomonas sp. FB-Cd]